MFPQERRWRNAKTGEHLTVEFLGFDPTTERYVLFYKPSLERLGISVNEIVDAVPVG